MLHQKKKKNFLCPYKHLQRFQSKWKRRIVQPRGTTSHSNLLPRKIGESLSEAHQETKVFYDSLSKKSLLGLTYCNIFYVATLKKLISKGFILAVFRGKPRELIYFKNPEQDPHNSTFTSSFKGH